MKFGAEPKKVAVLGGLVLVAVAVYFFNSDSTPTPQPSRRPVPLGAAAPGTVTTEAAARANRTRATSTAGSGEFKPGIGPKRGQPRPDPATMDPTLRLDLLAKVQAVKPESSLRNLFQFGAAQAAAKPLPAMPNGVPKIPTGPKLQATAPPINSGPPQPPSAPPMTFKYYGYKLSKVNGIRQAFLLDGEDIIVAGENELFKKRYKIVKIGANSITIEDTQFNHSQTLPLQEDAVG